MSEIKPAGEKDSLGYRKFTDEQFPKVIEALGLETAITKLGVHFTKKQRDILFDLVFEDLSPAEREEIRKDWPHKRLVP